VPDVAGLTTRRLVAALVALVVVFVAVVALGEVIAAPANAVSSPSHSLLRLVEDVFPPRRLTVAEIARGGPTCLDGNTLVVPSAGGGCTFIIPNGVHVAEFRRVPGSPAMMVTFSQTGDLTQNIDTGAPGPDPHHPLQLRVATVHDGTTVTLYGCRGPGSCRLVVAG
jgi:hypothetical protein